MSSTMSSVLEIIGKPDVFPSYGRNTKAWSLNKCTNNDLIDVYFKDPLYIEEITIYETYNGGAVWKIEGVDVHGDSRIITQTSKKTIQKFQEARMLKINKKIDWSTSTLRIHIDCTKMNDTSQIDAVRITGRPVEGTCSWYNSFSCPPCKCDTIGSSSTSCTSDGQCRCKVGYYGKKCGNRDCLLGKWTSWSSCQCGPGKIKSRTRPIIQSRVGSGKICKKTSESISCNIKCLCKTGERGTVCEHKDCLVSDWGEWSACPLQNVPYSCNKIRHIYGERFRHRTITREKQNNGQACPSLSEKKLCKMLMCGGTKLRG